MPFIRTSDGTDLFYKDWGSGPTVVFCHAWSLSSAMWEYQFAALRNAGMRCVAFDRRGHGRSDVPNAGYDLDTLAGDIATVVEHLDLREITLVAHSMGTLEITRYMAAHGTDRVARAVYVGTMAPGLVHGQDAPTGLEKVMDATLADLQTDRPKWFHDSAPAYFATDGTGAWVSQALVDDAIRTILEPPLEVQVECLRTVFDADLRADLRGIGVPALVVHGDRDVSAPIDLTGRPTAALLPGSRFEVYRGAPHGLYVTEQDRLTRDLLAFARH
jgi:non-heme chloroperoxidase